MFFNGFGEIPYVFLMVDGTHFPRDFPFGVGDRRRVDRRRFGQHLEHRCRAILRGEPPLCPGSSQWQQTLRIQICPKKGIIPPFLF